MNATVKKEWIRALRSGEYKRGSGVLRSSYPSTGLKFCCLGVLCDVYAKAMKESWVGDEFLGCASYLPALVQVWARLDSTNPSLGGKSAASWNDDGASFNDIADLIEEHL